MKFRAVVTQYFSFIDSSQNNPSPGVCWQLSWAREAAGGPSVPSARCRPASHGFGEEKAAVPAVLAGRGGSGMAMGTPGHPSRDPGPGNATLGEVLGLGYEWHLVRGAELGKLGIKWGQGGGGGWHPRGVQVGGPDTWGSEPEEVAARILTSDPWSFIFHFHSFIKYSGETVNWDCNGERTRQESLSLCSPPLRGGRPVKNGIKT